MLQSVQHYTLHTGRICEHRSYRVRVITALHYHVLVFEQTPEPTLAEQQELRSAHHSRVWVMPMDFC